MPCCPSCVRILLVGNGTFVAPLRALGHEVLEVFADDPELAAPGRPFDVRECWRRSGASADVLLVVDTLGRQTLPYGVEDLPIPRVYYAIDIHLNFFWQRHYARLFDLTLVAQKDYVALLGADGVPARWLPSAVDATAFGDRGLPRIYDVAFVGIVDAARPKRAAVVELLQERFGLMVFGASPAVRLSAAATARIFGSSKIVFNESVLGDVNFRTFEAMACGAMLLTERVGNGLEDLFTPGVHLALYTPADLVEQLAYYLEHADERARIAAAGTAEVLARHTLSVRAAEMSALLESAIVRRDTAGGARRAWGLTAHLTVVRGLADPSSSGKLAAESLRVAFLGEGSIDAGVALAEIMAWAGRDAGALAILAEVHRLAPGDLRGWLLAAEIEHRLDRADAAAELVRGGLRAADLAPPTRDAALAALDLGLESSECLHALGVALQEAGAPFTPGLVRHVDGGMPTTALDYFTKAVERDPANRAAAESAAALLEFVGLPEFAVQFHQTIVDAVPGDLAARQRLCGALAASYQWTVMAHHRRVLTVLEGDELADGDRVERAEAYYEAGIGLRRRGAALRAIVALDRAAEYAPGRLEPIADGALARIDAGEYGAARRCLEQALAIAGTAERETLEALLALVRDRYDRPSPR